ncbi:MAG: hypothetical protein WC178_02895 [Candidatus Paceibacterota bacterium]
MNKIKDKKIEIREIVYSQDDEKSFGDIFVYEPENIEEQNLGNLFIIGELKNLPRNCSYIINLLASKIKKEFYSDTKRTSEESLEAALSVANKTLSEIADQGNGEYIGKLSMICGTYRGNRFYLSQVGKIKSLLMRNGQLLEIIKEDTNRNISPKRVFNDIASGELSDGDLVLFATLGLLNIFSLEELKQLGTSLNLDEFSCKIQEEIEEGDGEIVSALLMRIGEEKIATMNHINIITEEEEKLEEDYKDKEEEYDNINNITSSEKIAVDEEYTDKKDGYIDSTRTGIEEKKENSEYDSPEKKEPLVPRKKENETAIKKEGAVTPLQNLPENLINKNNILPSEEKIITDSSLSKDIDRMSLDDVIKEYEKMEDKTPENVTEKEKNIEEMVNKKESNGFEDLDEKAEPSYKKLFAKIKKHTADGNFGKINLTFAEKIRKIFQNKKEYRVKSVGTKLGFIPNKKILIALVAIVIISTLAFRMNSSKDEVQNTEKLATYQAILSDANAKMEQAELEVIAGSNQSAGQLFIEARNSALQVRDEFDALDTDAEKIIADAQSEIDKIDLVVKVENLETIAEFENNDVNNMVEVAGAYYAINGKENTVYEIDEKGTSLLELAQAKEKIGEVKFAENLQNQEILFSDGSTFLSFNLKSGTIQTLDTELDASFTDFATYGSFAYLLSSSQNQIYKYQKSSVGLNNKTEWIKDGDISDAISLAIDQNIYILTSDGQVKKYFTGSEVINADGSKFEIKQPSDTINNPVKIYTLTDQKYLYITEPSKNRIVLFDKATGVLVRQYANENFSDLQDISINEDETTMFVLLKDKIVKIDLEA